MMIRLSLRIAGKDIAFEFVGGALMVCQFKVL